LEFTPEEQKLLDWAGRTDVEMNMKTGKLAPFSGPRQIVFYIFYGFDISLIIFMWFIHGDVYRWIMWLFIVMGWDLTQRFQRSLVLIVKLKSRIKELEKSSR